MTYRVGMVKVAGQTRFAIGFLSFALAVTWALTATPVVSAAVSAESIPGPRWTSQAGQAFNDGWSPLSTSATYQPCQTVRWSFDRSNEDPERNTMINDVRTALATLQPLTGLTFTEVASGSPAELSFRWGDLTAEGHPNAAGFGGFTGWNKGWVTFDTKADWTLNKWEGWDWRRLEWPRPDLGPGWYSWKEGPGRVALAIHESMHAMGFGHVTDFTSIMYPQGGLPNNRGQFSSGDLAGLKTMYLNRPCGSATAPVISTPTSESAAAAPATGAVLVTVSKGTKVVSSNVSATGVMSATVKTPLARGSKVNVRVTSESPSAFTKVGRVVQSGGIVKFTHALTTNGTVTLLDSRGRTLVTWRSTNS